VLCSECQNWFHPKCVGLDITQIPMVPRPGTARSISPPSSSSRRPKPSQRKIADPATEPADKRPLLRRC
jgi:hypothetical protein